MTSARRALITGITGQDGSYLTEFLLAKGYEVYGVVRQSSSGRNLGNLNLAMRTWGDEEHDRLMFLDGDMTDPGSLRQAVAVSDPHEIYNLAAQSFVGNSWNLSSYTMEVNAMGFLHLLEAARQLRPEARIYQASTSEMYGNSLADASGEFVVLDENSPMRPRSPYGVAKLAAHRMARVYRESHDMFVACGICFNHESPRRGEMFVTRKIAKAVARIRAAKQFKITLGDLRPKRDWGHASEYVRAMWLMLQAPSPRDYVIATGESHSVREFVEAAFRSAGIRSQKRIDGYIEQDPQFMRPAEIYDLRGDPSAIRSGIGWENRIDFETLVHIMVNAELKEVGLMPDVLTDGNQVVGKAAG